MLVVVPKGGHQNYSKLMMADESAETFGWIYRNYAPSWLCWNCQEELAHLAVFTFVLITGRDATPQQHRHRQP